MSLSKGPFLKGSMRVSVGLGPFLKGSMRVSIGFCKGVLKGICGVSIFIKASLKGSWVPLKVGFRV